MNCCKCGKQLPAGVVLCLTCEKDLERVPDESIRLGYYARHPEALAALLAEAPNDDLAKTVCRHDCVQNPDAEDIDCTDEGYAACIVRWLLEPVEKGQQPETVDTGTKTMWGWMMNRFTRGEQRND